MSLALTLAAVARLLAAGDTTSALRAAPADPARATACEALAPLRGVPADAARGVAASIALHGATARWADRAGAPIRVWVEPRVDRESRSARTPAEWRHAVTAALTAWGRVPTVPRFALVDHAIDAEVRVVWAPALSAAAADSFATGLASFAAGRTELTRADDGEVRRAVVTLARATPTGVPYSRRDVTAVAVHELGHVLGLAHRSDAPSVMSPLVTVDAVTDVDAATVRALYALPVGTRCAEPPATR
jgi:hypothetical protein